MQRQLAILRDEYGGVFVDLGLIDPSGIQQEYTGPLNLTKANYAGTPWFSAAKSQAYYLSDVFTGLRGSPHFIVAAKVSIQDQPWILRATVDFKAFNALVSNIRIGQSGFAFILNRAGDFQTKPEVEQAPDYSLYKNILSASLNPAKVVIKEAQNGHGVQQLTAYTPLNSGRWILCFQQESGDAFATLADTRNLAIALYLASVLAAALVAFILARRITARINEALLEKDQMSDQVIEAGRLASIGELAAGIAHEINNPVAIMVEEAGWIGDLLDEDEPASDQNLVEIRRASDQIRNQGSRCKEITHKLLSFARKTDPTTEEIYMNDLIGEVVSLIDQKTRYANVKLITELDPALPSLSAPVTELQQVLLNLFNNSVDAIGGSGGIITVRSRLQDGNIEVEVEDNGMGIAPANLARIFDPFYTTKPVGQGTGLGLSICYGIIKKLGGDIRVRSAKQKGTTFTIVLPAQTAQSSQGHTHYGPAGPGQAARQPNRNQGGETVSYLSTSLVNPSVLLVDDEVPFVEALAKRIAKRDVTVSKAFGGQEALDRLADSEGSSIDVVVLDVKMPGMDGLETLRAVKQQHPNIEVIMLTGHATVENAIEGMKSGAYDYLLKPCDMEQLMGKITKAVRKKREHENKILEAKAQVIAMQKGY